MENDHWTSMSIDELWTIHQKIAAVLKDKIEAERASLDDRLRKVELVSNVRALNRVRRKYPKVLPRYRNPKNPAEKWSGRGKRPNWLSAEIQFGKKLDDFLID